MEKFTINLNVVSIRDLDGNAQYLPEGFCKGFGNNIYMQGADIDEKDAGRLIHLHSKSEFVEVTEQELDTIVRVIHEKSQLGFIFKEEIRVYAESIKNSPKKINQ